MKKYVRFSDQDQVDIVNSYTVDLKTMIQLAAQYGATRQAIHKVLKRAGIDTSKQAAWMKVSCTCCGKEIERLRCIIRKTKHLFCSEDCYFAWLKHGNGNPLVIHQHSSKTAREIIKRYWALCDGQIVHHEDRNQFNNLIWNLKVFKNQGDHVRYHRGFIVPVLFDGSLVKREISG
jgi:hypothetical protein